MDYSLLEKQMAFSLFAAKLVLWCKDQGIDITLGEAWRSDETAKLDAQEGKGISHSLHRLRLAEDFNFFKGGKLLTTYEEILPIGEYWEAHSSPGMNCAWGGRFKSRDCVHFSIEHLGIR